MPCGSEGGAVSKHSTCSLLAGSPKSEEHFSWRGLPTSQPLGAFWRMLRGATGIFRCWPTPGRKGLQGSADTTWDTPQGASGQLQGGSPTVGRARCHAASMTICRWDYPELCEPASGVSVSKAGEPCLHPPRRAGPGLVLVPTRSSACPQKGRKIIQAWAKIGVQLFVWEITQ